MCPCPQVLRGKSTADQAGEMHDLMAEMMLESKLDDREVFRQLVLESRSGMESRVQGGGHSVAAGRLDAMDSVAGYVDELMGGLAQLEYLKVGNRVDVYPKPIILNSKSETLLLQTVTPPPDPQ